MTKQEFIEKAMLSVFPAIFHKLENKKDDRNISDREKELFLNANDLANSMYKFITEN